jgi:hypothetical protein
VAGAGSSNATSVSKIILITAVVKIDVGDVSHTH